MKKHFLGCLFFLGVFLINAQTPDLVRLEYTVIPENDAGIQTSRYRAVLNAPIKLSEKNNYLVIGAEFNRYHFDINRPLPFESSTLESLKIVDLNLGYTFKWNEDWRFIGAITPVCGVTVLPLMVGLLSSGIPFKYFLVSIPWAKGENAMEPIPFSSNTVNKPSSTQRSNIL